MNPQMVMYEEEFNQIQAVVDRLVKEANAKVVFIVDKNGQLIAASGEVDNIDTTSLASLTAGNIAATGGIAKRYFCRTVAGPYGTDPGCPAPASGRCPQSGRSRRPGRCPG